MWLGPKLKFARARVKVQDAAALLIENWGGDRWGHTVSCSPFDFFSTPRFAPVACYTLFPTLEELYAPLHAIDANAVSRYERFELRPCLDVPEGEVWLKFPEPGSL
jgi:hypothetical protein